MLVALSKRMLHEVDGRALRKFVVNFGWKGSRAVARFRKRLARGERFPAFLFVSITSRCNLACQGCWISAGDPAAELSVEALEDIVRVAKAQGSYFFGLLGGEPLLHRGLFDVVARHPDCYFLLFTNGTLIDDAVAGRMRALGNVSPLVSVEGLERVSDERRGGAEVYRRTLDGIGRCAKHRLVTGVATSVCRSNYDDLVSESFVNELVERRVHYLWYYIYRPVGPRPAPELALSAEQILGLRRFLVDIRGRAPIVVVDAYWDQNGRALCPAASGIAHHIGPGGDIEPCPPIQFARDRIGRAGWGGAGYDASGFLRDFSAFAGGTTAGCILMERPDLLRDFVVEHEARDTSGRGTAREELGRMTACPSHHLEGCEIPERQWFYRMAKKNFFFGLGAYG